MIIGTDVNEGSEVKQSNWEKHQKSMSRRMTWLFLCLISSSWLWLIESRMVKQIEQIRKKMDKKDQQRGLEIHTASKTLCDVKQV